MSMTAAEAQTRLRHRKTDLLQGYKAAKGCSRCPEGDPACLDFHHLNPADKHPKLSRAGRGGRRGWETLSYVDIAAELEKVEVLCANCHRKETSLQRQRA